MYVRAVENSLEELKGSKNPKRIQVSFLISYVVHLVQTSFYKKKC